MQCAVPWRTKCHKVFQFYSKKWVQEIKKKTSAFDILQMIFKGFFPFVHIMDTGKFYLWSVCLMRLYDPFSMCVCVGLMLFTLYCITLLLAWCIRQRYPGYIFVSLKTKNSHRLTEFRKEKHFLPIRQSIWVLRNPASHSERCFLHPLKSRPGCAPYVLHTQTKFHPLSSAPCSALFDSYGSVCTTTCNNNIHLCSDNLFEVI